MGKNREDFTELCASIVEIITMLQEEISRPGADAASRLTQFCDQLKRCGSPGLFLANLTFFCSLLLEIQQGLGKLQKKGVRPRIKEFVRSTSIGDELKRYKSRVKELRLNFIVSPSLPYMLPPHTCSKTLCVAQRNIPGMVIPVVFLAW
jgi:hypothetical protein